jgi:hypothetical protein
MVVTDLPLGKMRLKEDQKRPRRAGDKSERAGTTGAL